MFGFKNTIDFVKSNMCKERKVRGSCDVVHSNRNCLRWWAYTQRFKQDVQVVSLACTLDLDSTEDWGTFEVDLYKETMLASPRAQTEEHQPSSSRWNGPRWPYHSVSCCRLTIWTRYCRKKGQKQDKVMNMILVNQVCSANGKTTIKHSQRQWS